MGCGANEKALSPRYDSNWTSLRFRSLRSRTELKNTTGDAADNPGGVRSDQLKGGGVWVFSSDEKERSRERATGGAGGSGVAPAMG